MFLGKYRTGFDAIFVGILHAFTDIGVCVSYAELVARLHAAGKMKGIFNIVVSW